MRSGMVQVRRLLTAVEMRLGDLEEFIEYHRMVEDIRHGLKSGEQAKAMPAHLHGLGVPPERSRGAAGRPFRSGKMPKPR